MEAAVIVIMHAVDFIMYSLHPSEGVYPGGLPDEALEALLNARSSQPFHYTIRASIVISVYMVPKFVWSEPLDMRLRNWRIGWPMLLHTKLFPV